MKILDDEQTLPGADGIRVLQAYVEAQCALAAVVAIANEAPADSDDQAVRRVTWVPRLKEIEGVPAGRLAPIHGRLIALGLLQFQIEGRRAGVQYQLTPAGRRALQDAAPLDDMLEGTDDETDTVEDEPLQRSA